MQCPDSLSHPLSQKAHIVTKIKTISLPNLGGTLAFAISKFSFFFFFFPRCYFFDKTLNENGNCLVFTRKDSRSRKKWWKPQYFHAFFTGEQGNTDPSQSGCHLTRPRAKTLSLPSQLHPATFYIAFLSAKAC